MNMYKKKPLRFTHNAKDVKSIELSANRHLSRNNKINILRDVSATTTVFKEGEKFACKAKSQSKAESRLEMLKKWKEERILKKELELKLKKPVFKVGKVSTLNSGLSSMNDTVKSTNSNSLKSSNAVPKIQSKTPAVTVTKSTVSKIPGHKSKQQISQNIPKSIQPSKSSKPNQISTSSICTTQVIHGVKSKLQPKQNTSLKNFHPPNPKTLQKQEASNLQEQSDTVSKDISQKLKRDTSSRIFSKKNVTQGFKNVTFRTQVSSTNSSFAPKDFLFEPPQGLSFYCLNEQPSDTLAMKILGRRTSTPIKPSKTSTNEDDVKNCKEDNICSNSKQLENTENLSPETCISTASRKLSETSLSQLDVETETQGAEKVNSCAFEESEKPLRTVPESSENNSRPILKSTPKTSRKKNCKNFHFTPRHSLGLSRFEDNIFDCTESMISDENISLMGTPVRDYGASNMSSHTTLTDAFRRLHLDKDLAEKTLSKNIEASSPVLRSPEQKTDLSNISLLYTPIPKGLQHVRKCIKEDLMSFSPDKI